MSESPPPESVGRAVQAALKEPSLHLGVGIVVGLYLTIILSPILGLMVVSFIPTPLVYFYYRGGRVFGLTLIAAAGILIALVLMMVDMLLIGPFFLESAVLAVVMGECLGRRFRPGWIVGAPAAAALGLTLILFWVVGLNLGLGPGEVLKSAMRDQVKMAMELSEAISRGEPVPEIGQDSGTAPDGGAGNEAGGIMPDTAVDSGEVDRNLDKLVEAVIAIIPALLLNGFVVLAWVNFLLARSFLLRKNALAPELRDLTTWKTTDKAVWPVIAAGFGMLFIPGMIRMVSANVLLIMFMVYFFQGLAVVAHWLRRKAVPPFTRGLVYAFIIFWQVMALVVAAIGFFDTWLDFRKLKNADSGVEP